jgi:hypothetical protein
MSQSWLMFTEHIARGAAGLLYRVRLPQDYVLRKIKAFTDILPLLNRTPIVKYKNTENVILFLFKDSLDKTITLLAFFVQQRYIPVPGSGRFLSESGSEFSNRLGPNPQLYFGFGFGLGFGIDFGFGYGFGSLD